MLFYFYGVGHWAGIRTVEIFTEMLIVLRVKFLLCV